MFYTALSILPKDYVLELYKEWLGSMQRAGSDSARYRQQIYEVKGFDFDMSQLSDQNIFNLQIVYNPYAAPALTPVVDPYDIFDDEDLPF